VPYSRAALVKWAGEKIELSKRDRYVLMGIAGSVGLERLGTYITTEELSAASGQSAAEVVKALGHLEDRLLITIVPGSKPNWAIRLNI
jgi:hypothetical protein